MLEIPGYRWDEATKRYYKDDRRASQTVARSAAGHSGKNVSNKPALGKKPSQAASVPQDGRRARFWRLSSPPSYLLLDALPSRPLSAKLQADLRERSISATFSNLKEARTEQPNLSHGDIITCFEFDREHPDVMRYGTSAGLIGRGRLSAHRSQTHSVDEWEMEHILGAPISSVHMSQGFFVGTSLGPIAQAVFGRTDSLSHVKFAPRQTSLWSSSIWKTQVALGCDKKVLYARNPADQAFQSFGTGSAVFALDLHEDELFVGTRSGHVRLFDVRQRVRKEDIPSPQVLLRLRSPVTHIRRLSDRTVVIAQMDGNLARFDTRWLKERPEPLTQYKGHVNTQTRTLGLDVWNEQILAAAGEDNIVRKWSLANGSRISGTTCGRNSASISASTEETTQHGRPIQFQPGKASLWISTGRVFQEYA